jgi:hypothetical protein
MPNAIKSVVLEQTRLEPAESEQVLTVYPQSVGPSTQIKGRLVGPHSVYSTTVEVAYPMRECNRHCSSMDVPRISVRVVIPEASFWEPDSPFLYQGPLELWEDGQCVDRLELEHGLRIARLGPRGLRFNGKLTRLNGVARSAVAREYTPQLRQWQCNTLLVPLAEQASDMWRAADQTGFLMLGRIQSAGDLEIAAELIAAGQSRHLPHPSTLGWLVHQDVSSEKIGKVLGSTLFSSLSGRSGEDAIVGIEITQPPTAPPPEGVAFVACREEWASSAEHFGLPLLYLSDQPLPSLPAEPTPHPSRLTLGTIYEVER